MIPAKPTHLCLYECENVLRRWRRQATRKQQRKCRCPWWCVTSLSVWISATVVTASAVTRHQPLALMLAAAAAASLTTLKQRLRQRISPRVARRCAARTLVSRSSFTSSVYQRRRPPTQTAVEQSPAARPTGIWRNECGVLRSWRHNNRLLISALLASPP